MNQTATATTTMAAAIDMSPLPPRVPGHASGKFERVRRRCKMRPAERSDAVADRVFLPPVPTGPGAPIRGAVRTGTLVALCIAAVLLAAVGAGASATLSGYVWTPVQNAERTQAIQEAQQMLLDDLTSGAERTAQERRDLAAAFVLLEQGELVNSVLKVTRAVDPQLDHAAPAIQQMVRNVAGNKETRTALAHMAGSTDSGPMALQVLVEALMRSVDINPTAALVQEMQEREAAERNVVRIRPSRTD